MHLKCARGLLSHHTIGNVRRNVLVAVDAQVAEVDGEQVAAILILIQSLNYFQNIWLIDCLNSWKVKVSQLFAVVALDQVYQYARKRV